MSKLLIICWLIVLVCTEHISSKLTSFGGPKTGESEVREHVRQDTAPGEWPWHAALYHRDRESDTYTCGGTLISEMFVLTAAHYCVVDRNGYQLPKNRTFVRIGVHNLDALNADTVQQHEIERIHQPSNNTDQNLRNDIALLELSSAATFNDFVQPVCLTSTRDPTGQLGTVIGWGLEENYEIYENLTSGLMVAIDPLTCLASNRAQFGALLDEGMFCAAYANGTSVCNGYTGGGIFFNEDNVWYLGGILSFMETREMDHRCKVKASAAFTKVYTFIQWISSITKQEFVKV